ncbi:MAG: hypothetical protein LAC66_02970 [Methylotenera sp.]|nr:hypothetical protein [Methylotenera sp.]
MTENESAIEQINLGFNEQEDRLLLKVGLADKTEVAVWISRRVAKQIWAALQQAGSALLPSGTVLSSATGHAALDKHQAVDNFVRDAELQQKIVPLDFQSAYLNDRKARSEQPLLALVCQTVSVGNLPPTMELQCSTGQSVKMAMTGELIQALASMLQLATREANWDLVMTSFVQAGSAPTSKPVLH